MNIVGYTCAEFGVPLIMTLTEYDDNSKMQQKPQNQLTVGHALRDTIWQGLEQGRLTCGMFECAKHLEINPHNIMLCVLPEDMVGDVSVHIHHTLIEAFCMENNIRLVRVDSEDKLASVVKCRPGQKMNDNDVAGGRVTYSDAGCVIVDYPEEDLSPAEVMVTTFCKSVAGKGYGPASLVTIPA
ncbi:growth arrest and DNA damage-inducible protein GADD45 gamma-like [Haliotis cracherodii]|uniref:growth arrest and DNA damage-inducible protein GADD45 gamma-like n=1 Tax=Haliotis rufescens TaxID=6454 RepID=UPI001EAF95ED|nr:growth arrest and DNA damage-inducible protein GADD45 gamma-like [Haliotis rufescens]